MVHCYICDSSIEHPVIDGRDGKIKPCSTCESIAMEAAGQMGDQEDEMDLIPFVDEDSSYGGDVT